MPGGESLGILIRLSLTVSLCGANIMKIIILGHIVGQIDQIDRKIKQCLTALWVSATFTATALGGAFATFTHRARRSAGQKDITMVMVRGIEFQGNLDNMMGLEFYNLSHRFGFQHPNWPYFQDVKIERIHYMAKSGVLSQRITTTMHATTHIDAPAHVVQGTPFIDEVPLPHFLALVLWSACPRRSGISSLATILRRPVGMRSARAMC